MTFDHHSIGGNVINTAILINQWSQRFCFKSCNKEHCNTDRNNKTAVVVFTDLNYFDNFNIF